MCIRYAHSPLCNLANLINSLPENAIDPAKISATTWLYVLVICMQSSFFYLHFSVKLCIPCNITVLAIG